MSEKKKKLQDRAKDLVLVPLHTYLLVDKATPNLDRIIEKSATGFADIFYDTLIANNKELVKSSKEDIEEIGSFLLNYITEVELALTGDGDIIEISISFNPNRLDLENRWEQLDG